MVYVVATPCHQERSMIKILLVVILWSSDGMHVRTAEAPSLSACMVKQAQLTQELKDHPVIVHCTVEGTSV